MSWLPGTWTSSEPSSDQAMVPAIENGARLLRTIRALHPVQLLCRAPQMLCSKLIGTVPSGHGPSPRSGLKPSLGLGALMDKERTRASDRLARLPEASLLKQFEENFGYEALLPTPDSRRWLARYGQNPRRVASHPFPASIRARNLAVATRQGFLEAGAELTRAARAVCLQPELHLLGNHLLANAFALTCAGAVMKGPEAELWWSVGRALLEWQLPAQYLSDGGHFERSVSYHLALLTGLLQCIDLGRTGRSEAPDLWEATASLALGWAVELEAPDGTYPLFNDSMLDAAPSIRDVANYAACLGILPKSCAHSSSQSEHRISVLPATGWVVMENDRAWLAFDAGNDGATQQPGHVHADALGFELWVDGVRTVVDYGVSSYLDDAERERTRATRSHNTVELDGQNSCEVWSRFRVGRRQSAELRYATVDGQACIASARHDGYRYLSGSPVHERRISLSSNDVQIEDRIEGLYDRAVSRIRIDATSARTIHVQGDEAPAQRDGFWHPMYGQARPCVVYEFEQRPPKESSRVLLHWE